LEMMQSDTLDSVLARPIETYVSSMGIGDQFSDDVLRSAIANSIVGYDAICGKLFEELQVARNTRSIAVVPLNGVPVRGPNSTKFSVARRLDALADVGSGKSSSSGDYTLLASMFNLDVSSDGRYLCATPVQAGSNRSELDDYYFDDVPNKYHVDLGDCEVKHSRRKGQVVIKIGHHGNSTEALDHICPDSAHPRIGETLPVAVEGSFAVVVWKGVATPFLYATFVDWRFDGTVLNWYAHECQGIYRVFKTEFVGSWSESFTRVLYALMMDCGVTPTGIACGAGASYVVRVLPRGDTGGANRPHWIKREVDLALNKKHNREVMNSAAYRPRRGRWWGN
jgi:hypothetical protein